MSAEPKAITGPVISLLSFPTWVAKERCKKLYGKNLKPRKFFVGDDVYLNEEPNNSTFDAHWTGPYKVTRAFDDWNVEIAIETERRLPMLINSNSHVADLRSL